MPLKHVKDRLEGVSSVEFIITVHYLTHENVSGTFISCMISLLQKDRLCITCLYLRIKSHPQASEKSFCVHQLLVLKYP